jgi:hypothetical protein
LAAATRTVATHKFPLEFTSVIVPDLIAPGVPKKIGNPPEAAKDVDVVTALSK